MSYISEMIGGVVLLTVVFFGFISLMNEYRKLTRGTDNAGSVQHDIPTDNTGGKSDKTD